MSPFTHKNAATLGAKGGRKGGKKRAKMLTAKERAAIARMGGLARHKKDTP